MQSVAIANARIVIVGSGSNTFQLTNATLAAAPRLLLRARACRALPRARTPHASYSAADAGACWRKLLGDDWWRARRCVCILMVDAGRPNRRLALTQTIRATANDQWVDQILGFR